MVLNLSNFLEAIIHEWLRGLGGQRVQLMGDSKFSKMVALLGPHFV